MASSSVTKAFASALLSSLLFISIVAISVSSRQFEVGGYEGWVKPSQRNRELYNDWASQSRFHVGDALYFRYQNDSVLEVNRVDYDNCITTNPISKFEDGKTVFRFDRHGFFYFISGQAGHCRSGQKLIVHVIMQSEVEPPESAASPGAGGGSSGRDGWHSDFWGPPGLNSTTRLSVASYFMTALGGVIVIFYLFM